jgi:hypothetical protein
MNQFDNQKRHPTKLRQNLSKKMAKTSKNPMILLKISKNLFPAQHDKGENLNPTQL